MASDLDQIAQDIHANTSAVQSAIQFLTALAQRIDAVTSNRARVAVIAKELEAGTVAPAAAVVANTPTEPAPDEQ